jgi:hypothetical protein
MIGNKLARRLEQLEDRPAAVQRRTSCAGESNSARPAAGEAEVAQDDQQKSRAAAGTP